MRWLLAILIMANGVAFYWFSGQQSPRLTDNDQLGRVQVGSSQAEQRPSLLLLSERPVDDTPEKNEEAVCIVIGPVVELVLIEQLSGELSGLAIDHQRWVEIAENTDESAGQIVDETLPPPIFYWLQFRASQRQLLGEGFWRNIGIASPATEISEKSCTTVASQSDFP